MRDSKIEALRIYLAIMIVVIHVLSKGEHFTTTEVWQSSPLPFPFVILRCLSSVAVNAFMFISGWYGIKFTFKGVLKLYYQGLFYSLLSTITLLSLHQMNWGQIIASFFPITRGQWWFLSSYVAIYIISP